jgi:hypothetical protein
MIAYSSREEKEGREWEGKRRYARTLQSSNVGQH